MRVFITEGPGQGQYGYIWQYDIPQRQHKFTETVTELPDGIVLFPGSCSATVLNALTTYTIESE